MSFPDRRAVDHFHTTDGNSSLGETLRSREAICACASLHMIRIVVVELEVEAMQN
jgi:hypothetical protein